MSKVKPGKYKHYKGDYYEVLYEGYYEPTEEEVVIYKALYDSQEFGDEAIWVRPKDEFLADVEWEGEIVPRFEFVGEN
ncbi:MAG: DUF1653 domain-containing protein [Candidatus Paceibacteria bacterium]